MRQLLAYTAITLLLLLIIWGIPLWTSSTTPPGLESTSQYTSPLNAKEQHQREQASAPEREPDDLSSSQAEQGNPLHISPAPKNHADIKSTVNPLLHSAPGGNSAASAGEKIQQFIAVNGNFKPLEIGSIDFQKNAIALSAHAIEKLDKLVPQLKAYDPNVNFEIRGYTDNKGSAEYNRWLSQKRAEKVRAYLIYRGFPPERLKATGFGGNKPIADNNSEEGRVQNRRVEIQPY
ncbi:MAG: OmpA family protein [Thiotrichales bacterium]